MWLFYVPLTEVYDGVVSACCYTTHSGVMGTQVRGGEVRGRRGGRGKRSGGGEGGRGEGWRIV